MQPHMLTFFGVPVFPAEIGRMNALTREPDTVSTVVGKDAALLSEMVCIADFFIFGSEAAAAYVEV